MQKLVAIGRIQASETEVYNPGTCLPESWSEEERARLLECGAAEMREVTEEDIALSTPVRETKIDYNKDTEKFNILVANGVATEEQISAITEAWEIKSWEDFKNLSESELVSVKGVGKATATKILAAVQEG